MTIRQLSIFKTVCEEESITRAAEKLSMAQPAISRAISELEDHLGTQLFDRYSRKVYLNETGRLLLSKVIPLLDLYDNLEECSKELDKLSALKIGATPTIARTLLPPAMKEFSLKYDSTPTQVFIDKPAVIEDMLHHHQIDVALIEGVVSGDELEKIPFSDFSLSIVCSPTYQFKSEGLLSADSLAEEPWLLMEKGTSIREAFDGAMMFHNLSVMPCWSSTSQDALIMAAKQGLGITMLPTILVEQELIHGELIEITVDGLYLNIANHIAFHSNKFQTAAFQAFINLILFQG